MRCQWNGGWLSVAWFDCRSICCWCARSICFVHGFQFLLAEPTGGGMPCPHFSVRVLLSLHWVDACLPGAIPVSLDIRPAGPDLVTKLLVVEALQWFSYVRSKPLSSVSLVNLGDGYCFPERTTFIVSVVVVVCVSIINFLSLETSINKTPISRFLKQNKKTEDYCFVLASNTLSFCSMMFCILCMVYPLICF